MGKRGNNRQVARPVETTDWSTERTMAEAEADQALPEAASDLVCPCGSKEFVLEAFLHIVNGVAKPEPLDLESLTCPQCGREFEAIQAEGGRYLRGDFIGYVDVDE
jgi:DNA-directed RNA polymerase subunit RPC12/RpoP